MGCFEIKRIYLIYNLQLLINFNMGCFEIKRKGGNTAARV